MSDAYADTKEACRILNHMAESRKAECEKLKEELAKYQWISVKDKLPETPKPDEGYCCFLVSDGSLIHMAYYTEDGWLFADSGEMKEMFYEVTHWMPLPEYPNHLRRMMLNERY